MTVETRFVCGPAWHHTYGPSSWHRDGRDVERSLCLYPAEMERAHAARALTITWRIISGGASMLEWDPGPPPSISAIFEQAPLQAYQANLQRFRLPWGPIFLDLSLIRLLNAQAHRCRAPKCGGFASPYL